MKFTLGSDPELMVVDNHGRLRSAIPLFSGTKYVPEKISGGTVIHDNVNVEFGIDPASTEDEWVERTGSVLSQIAKRLPDNMKLAAYASANFPKEELEHPEAKEFACDPDFDPYEFEVNFIPDGAADGTLRSAGGHVHVGHDTIPKSVERQAEAAKALDVFLGVPSVWLDRDPSSAKRRELYGKAGAHRPKPYGVEYRAIGNFWVTRPELTRLIYKLTRDGLQAFLAGHLGAIDWNLIRKTINAGKRGNATAVLRDFVYPLINKDTRELINSCANFPPTFNPKDGWGF